MSIHKIISRSKQKKKDHKWQVRWREFGKLKSKNFDRQPDAKKFEASILMNDGDEFCKAEIVISSPDFEKYCLQWIEDYGKIHKTAGSLVQDRQIIRDYFLPLWKGRTLENISRMDIVKLQSSLKREDRLSPKTINIITGLCHKVFKTAVEWEFLKINPAEGIKPLPVPEKDYSFWSFAERDRFLSWAKVNDPDLYSVIGVAVYTGLRRGEVEGLLRDCVDFERNFLVIKRSFCKKTQKLNEYTKGKRIRRIPMNSVVAQILKERSLGGLDKQMLPIDYDHLVVRRFRPSQIKAGVTPICFHALRHTTASQLAMSGASVFDIQKMLGHSSIETTMRYMHLAPGHLSGLTDRLLPKGVVQNTDESKSQIDDRSNVHQKFSATP